MMTKDKYSHPPFSLALLHPRYWGVWFGFGFLAIVVNLLPYRVLLMIGRQLGAIGQRYAKKRVHVTQRNLSLAFSCSLLFFYLFPSQLFSYPHPRCFPSNVLLSSFPS